MSPAWRVGIAGVSAIGVGFGFARYGYGLFLPEIAREFGLPVSTAGWIASAGYAGYLLALVAAGALADRVGPRPLVVAGGLAAAVGMALVAVADGSATLVAGLVLAGTSSGWVWAPYSDAVDRLIPENRRSRVLALLPTGTAFGVVVAGALAMAVQWRVAWGLFSLMALAVTAYNLAVIPGGAGRRSAGFGAAAGFSALRLYATALSYGLVGAVYWSFAVAAVSATGAAPVFWILTGLSGVAGLATGVLIHRWGLPGAHRVIFLALACAAGLLALAPGELTAVIASALLYGASFMAGSGLLAVWSHRLFPERPTAALSVALVFLAIGTIAGPAVMGVLAAGSGLGTALWVTAAIAALTLLAGPVRDDSRTATTLTGGEFSRGGHRDHLPH
ncbi:YbfB/YjiJ family MFS transporter [Saccharopolyspora taberi]|uniref:YbfB/YjiJ family MFS transporter n=1 Tax=Saccharopolyspora taberi TaxID=60895 RepID=A0ABN3VDL0_9PSEU